MKFDVLWLHNLHNLDKYLQFVKKLSWKKSVFLVWGCIRDILLWIKKEPEDIDVTWAFDPNDFWTFLQKNIDKTQNLSLFRTEKYWTMTVVDKKSKIQYEITPFREESWYSDHRRPDTIVWTNDLLLDAQRRDFTINCIYYYSNNDKQINLKNITDKELELWLKNLEKDWICFFERNKICVIQNNDLIKKIRFDNIDKDQTLIKYYSKLVWQKKSRSDIFVWRWFVIDPFKWINDLINQKIRAVGDPQKRIFEDKLRIIRALRFSQVLFFDFDKDLWSSLKKSFYFVKTIAKERLKIELDKVAKKWSLFGFVSLCDELNILKDLFPALRRTKKVDQPVRYHPFDVYSHTLLVLYNLEELLKKYKISGQESYLLKRWALYHDVWKPDQYYAYSIYEDKQIVNKIDVLNHRNYSWVLMQEDLSNLKFSNKELKEIKRYIDNHHYIHESVISSKKESHLKKLRKIFSQGWYIWTRNLIVLTQADILWQYNPLQKDNIILTDYLFDLLNKLQKEEWQFVLKKLCIDWNWIIKNLKVSSWPKVWEILQTVFERVLEDVKSRNKENYIKKFLKDKFGFKI